METDSLVKQGLDGEIGRIHGVCDKLIPICEWIVVNHVILEMGLGLRNVELLDLSEVFHKGSLRVRGVKNEPLLLVVVLRIEESCCYLDLCGYVLEMLLYFRVVLTI